MSKKVFLVGFRGTGIRNKRFANEHALIKVGHVGLAFEGEEMRIFGFHPTLESIATVGGEQAVFTWLKSLKPLPGALQLDTDVFRRAYALGKQGAKTDVWQMIIELSDDVFERVRQQALSWYTEQKLFSYSFPPENPLPDRDNCATFPRRLGLPLPEETGKLVFYISALMEAGIEWQPKEE